MTEVQANSTPKPSLGSVEPSTQTASKGIAERLLNQLTDGKAGTGDAQGTKVETPEEITADFGGTPRKFKVSELIATFEKKGELQQLESALEKKLKMAGNIEGFQALSSALDAMTPTQKSKLQTFFQNPTLLDGQSDDEDDSDMDNVIDKALAGKSERAQVSTVDKQLQAEFAEVKQAVRALAAIAQQGMQEKQQQTLDQQLSAAMSAFPVFAPRKGDKQQAAALAYMRKSILNSFTASPDAGLDSIVAEAARVMQGMTEGSATRVLADIEGSPNVVSPPEKKPNRADLMSGKIGAVAAQVLNRLNGR